MLSYFSKKKNVVFIFFVFIAIFFIYQNLGKESSFLSKVILSISIPPGKFSKNLKKAIVNFSKNYIVLQDLKAENDKIKRELADSQLKILEYESIVTDYLKLKEFFEFQQESEDQIKLAEVIGVSSSYTDHFVINKGRKHGILKNQAVISSLGVVGKILKVQENVAYVQLITNKKSGIPVLIKRTRDRGVIRGLGKDLLNLRFISLKSGIQEGDEIVASGLAGIFPKEFPIGKVKDFRENKYYYSLEADIEPFVNFSRTEFVFILISSKQNEVLPLFQEEL